MAKIVKNAELLNIMEDYNLFMSSSKQMQVPVEVRTEKPNHRSSLYVEQVLTSDVKFGNVLFDCEIRDKNPTNYSFQVQSDKIRTKVLARLDEGNAAHRNNFPDIPLAEQEITTPHFHKYDEEGRWVAYKTDSLSSQNKTALKIEEGFRAFCEEERLSSLDGTPMSISVLEDGVLPLDFDKDPLAGISF